MMMNRPKGNGLASDISEQARTNQTERNIRIRDILQRQQIQQQIQQSENMQRDPTLIQFNDLSTLSQKKFERARSKYLVDKLTGKLNNADYFLQLTRSMAELNGQDTDEFLSQLYAKGREHKEKEAAAALGEHSRIESTANLNISGENVLAKPKNFTEFEIHPEGLEKEKVAVH